MRRRFLDGLSDSQARFHVEYIKGPDNIDQATFEVVNFQENKAAGNGQDRRKQSTRMVRPDDDSDDELDNSIK